ncbi:hypothetical protein RHGRI_004319 [Rhododendron griersonianum]|uniref:Uncharacterized protein n=1 Tax=Rhododendron griersonianum TaxID=479676 RepID=A0AAV6L872_9ERIC|nr:hypothetical protein RHGRI_004319 [Rhododendron griersonianum]
MEGTRARAHTHTREHLTEEYFVGVWTVAIGGVEESDADLDRAPVGGGSSRRSMELGERSRERVERG